MAEFWPGGMGGRGALNPCRAHADALNLLTFREIYPTEPGLRYATQRGAATQAAVMGELLWALWPGPVDRWDEGNITRIKLYGGALSSATKSAVLSGANVFAIEAGGEWEILQAQHCVLVAPGEYELSGLLRGRLGSVHALRAPHPVGARFVLLAQKLARVSVDAHEWGEALGSVAPPAGGASTHNRAARFAVTLPHAALRPWAPAHVRARRDSAGDVAISWVRCARLGGDSWGRASRRSGRLLRLTVWRCWMAAAACFAQPRR